MPYILYKTDGTKLTTVDDATLDLTTDLAFVGKNYSGYGQVVNENFLKLLENFSSETQPENPIRGQLWYDKANGRLNVSYDGRSFKGLASIYVQEGTPIATGLVRGDLWWDSDAFQLKAFDGDSFQVVGPADPAIGRATWIPGDEEIGEDTAISTPISKATIDEQVVVIVSKETFTTTSILATDFPNIKRGITLANVDNNGKSINSGTVLWGSASHSILSDYANTATVAVALLNGGAPSLVSSTSTLSTTYYSTATTSTAFYTIVQRDNAGDIYANFFRGVATSARYADLAERYHSDSPYDQGTVVVIGGVNEITITNIRANTAVVGVISKDPAYMMNSEAGNDVTHPYVALKGRVPCRVVGPVLKGDLLVTSHIAGYAQAANNSDHPAAVLGKALENHTGDRGIIEVLIV